MSFFTSFCDFPQKEQQSVWFSRFSTKSGLPHWGHHARCPALVFLGTRSGGCAASIMSPSRKITLLGHARRFLDHHFVDQAVLLGLTRPHEEIAVHVLFEPIE